MITISQAIQEKIKETPFLEEGLSLGIINLSALARLLKPELEKKLWKNITVTALVMALNRLVLPTSTQTTAIELKKLKNLTVRSNLIEYALHNSSYSVQLEAELLGEVTGNKELFINFTQGINEVTLIVSQDLEQKIDALLSEEKIIDKISNLSSITLRLDKDHIYTPGVQYALLKSLAWENINIIETISSYSEITIVVDSQNIDKAFSCVKRLTE